MMVAVPGVRLVSVVFELLFVLEFVTSLNIPTCCPKGHVLVDSTGVNARLYRWRLFKCVPRPGDPIELYGFHIRNDNTNNIPKCEDVVAVKIHGPIPLGRNSCLGLLDGEYYALTCPVHPTELISEVNSVRKCCPVGSAYSFKEMKCSKLPSKSRGLTNFAQLFDEPTIVHSGSLECLSTSVVVDYRSSDFNVSFQNGDLIVGQSAFDTNSFCLESILNDKKSDAGDPMIAGSTGFSPLGTGASDLLSEGYLIRTCHTAAVCDRIACVRRCCRFDERLVRRNGTTMCIADPKDLHIDFYDIEHVQDGDGNFTTVVPKVFGVLQMQKCPKYPLRPEYSDSDIYYFHFRDGSLYLPAEKLFYKNNDYCVQNALSDFGNQVEAFLCFDSSEKGLVKFRVYSIGLMISSVFLGMTILVYLCVPKLLNIPGKNLICHALSMMCAYIGLFLIQHSNLQFTICYPLAFFIYFSFMATFAWLNIMCFDIWWTFGSSQGTRGLDSFRDSHRFLLYSVYAWGVPSIFTTITLCIDYFKLVSDYFHPNIGEGRCWFSQTSSPPHLLFFLTPIGILILTNSVLFVLTLRHCNRVKREIFRMQSSSSEKKSLKKRFISDKARFMMNTKLFIVMGVSWLLEIISTAFYTPDHVAIWYVSDFFNVLQGVFVFFIFVFKRRVWAAIMERLGVGKRNIFHPGFGTTVTTPTTMVTSMNDLRKMRSSDGFPLTPIHQQDLI
ncbi:unnamed protein product [Hermetia illucens]|uniref:G-protein coupled receptors family 2 profile 2 domain-containing protein n=1 Tax=Hermetia illucens TaxID=343691 RepID=A0A7R8YVK8_HERIL|nr:unnamed protein product [Hermetia illucens]